MAHDTADLLLPHADPEVRLIELVWDIPAEGPKLSPLLHYCVEETESKQQLPPGLRLSMSGRSGGGY